MARGMVDLTEIFLASSLIAMQNLVAACLNVWAYVGGAKKPGRGGDGPHPRGMGCSWPTRNMLLPHVTMPTECGPCQVKSYDPGYRGHNKFWDRWGPTALALGSRLIPGNALLHVLPWGIWLLQAKKYCHRYGSQKFCSARALLPQDVVRLTPRNVTMPYLVVLGQTLRGYLLRCRKNWDPRTPPFQVTQGHWTNKHRSVG